MRKRGSHVVSQRRLSFRTRFPEGIDPMQENVDNLKEETDTRKHEGNRPRAEPLRFNLPIQQEAHYVMTPAKGIHR